jgi:hypothetical protein
MTQTLELMLDSTQRQVRAGAEDVSALEKAQGIDLVGAGTALSAIVARVIAIYEAMEATDRLFQHFAGNTRPSAEAASRAELMVNGFEAFAVLADAVLRSVGKLPPDHRPRLERTSELKRLRDAAAEMASVYRGEAQYFSGAQFARWEDVRAKLGV